MAQIGPVTLSINTTAARQSFESVALAMQSLGSSALEQVLLQFDDLLAKDRLCSLVLFDDGRSLLGREPVDLPASRAGELHSLRVFPHERYVELVSAIARSGNAHAVRVVHDWPILSVASDSATVAEAGGESIPAGGGAR